jgi:hypothetical protein
MAEMIIPGTYIDVRAEGLISAARVATGVVGAEETPSRLRRRPWRWLIAQRPRPSSCPRAAGCSRISASWRSRSTWSRASCPRKSPGAEPHAGAESGQSADRTPPRPHRARQQPRQALPHRPRHQPPAEGGRTRCGLGASENVTNVEVDNRAYNVALSCRFGAVRTAAHGWFHMVESDVPARSIAVWRVMERWRRRTTCR